MFTLAVLQGAIFGLRAGNGRTRDVRVHLLSSISGFRVRKKFEDKFEVNIACSRAFTGPQKVQSASGGSKMARSGRTERAGTKKSEMGSVVLPFRAASRSASPRRPLETPSHTPQTPLKKASRKSSIRVHLRRPSSKFDSSDSN